MIKPRMYKMTHLAFPLLFCAWLLAGCNSPDSEMPKEEITPVYAVASISTTPDPEDCPGDSCLSFQISGANVSLPAVGRMVVDEPIAAYRGTIVIFSGGGGQPLWASPYPAWGWSQEDMQSHVDAVTSWKEAGFRIVRVQWRDSWFQGSTSNEGFAVLASRPATVVNWIADNLTEGEAPLCVGGGSGGAAQTSYLLTHYGLADRISFAAPWSGFWMGRLDIGCLDTDPRNAALHYSDAARRAVDLSFGFMPEADGSNATSVQSSLGPCSDRDSQFEEAFLRASISGSGDYHYPTTLVWHILGGNDTVGALSQGLTYYEAMVREGSPHVRLDILPGLPHSITFHVEGITKVRDVFLQECRIRTLEVASS